jgi:hypothetical protein
MCRVQELRPYLKGQGHTNILKFNIIAIIVNRYTHLCPDCNFVMHRRIVESYPFLEVQGLTYILKFHFITILLSFIGTHICVRIVTKDFRITCHKCLPYQDNQDDILCVKLMFLPPRSRSLLIVSRYSGTCLIRTRPDQKKSSD